ncbi:MAG: thiosulfate oxidation carrier protein SoxY, partial [Paracoccaceae bacterium]
MELTRRQTLALGIGATAAAALPLPAWASTDLTEEAIKAFTGGADVADGGVEIGAPEIAENGNTVPVE